MNLLLYSVMTTCLAANPDSDHIVARDLEPGFPQLAAIDPLTKLAFAPVAGATRVFRMPELRLMAQHFGLPGFPVGEICVQRTAAALRPDQLLAAMQTALPEAKIEILDYSRVPAPVGAIEFVRGGLRAIPAIQNGGLWNGAVRYAGSRRFPIWARVMVAVTVHRVLAIGDLRPGIPIQPGQLLLQTKQVLPVAEHFAESLDDVAGKAPRLPIRAGTEIRTDVLTNTQEIARGDRVQVDVFAGSAHLRFEGVAETSGGIGQLVSVRNPESNRRFRARVEDRGHVLVGSPGKEE